MAMAGETMAQSQVAIVQSVDSSFQETLAGACPGRASLDENVGHVLDYPKESGLEEDTMPIRLAQV